MTRTTVLVSLFFVVGLALLGLVWELQWQNSAVEILHYWRFLVLGLIGALIANSTGAGGGIVFVPAFSAYGLVDMEVVGTSTLIQCFGMSAGALAWMRNANQSCSSSELQLIKGVMLVGGLASISGVLTGQYAFDFDRNVVNITFRIFSVVVGAALLWMALRNSRWESRAFNKLGGTLAYGGIGIAGFVGGILISLISVGTGELIALLLILAGVRITIAVCCAVCLSSISVLSAAPMHVISETVNWEIVLFAAPAAIIGGTLARHICHILGPHRLKLFFSGWILISGLLG